MSQTIEVAAITFSEKGVTLTTPTREQRHVRALPGHEVRKKPYSLLGYFAGVIFGGKSLSKYVDESVEFLRTVVFVDVVDKWCGPIVHDGDKSVVIHFPNGITVDDHPGRTGIREIYDVLAAIAEKFHGVELHGREIVFNSDLTECSLLPTGTSVSAPTGGNVTRTERYVVTHKTDAEGNAILGVPANVEHVETVMHTPVAGAVQKKYHVAEDVGFGPGGGIASHTNDTFGKM